MEDIHKARIFDIAAGMGVSLDSSIRDVNARSLTLIKRTKENFRNFIDSATPSIYVIDILEDVTKPLYKNYNISIPELQFNAEITNALLNKTTSINTKQFQQFIEAATIKSTTKLEVLKTKGGSHLDYRNVFYSLGKEISTLFPKIGILLVSDPENMGLPTKHIFLGRSFSNLKSTINDTINVVLRKHSGDSKAFYGSTMAAGHTAVTLGGGTYGTNTPATQEALFKIEASRTKLIDTSNFTNEFVKRVPIFIKNSITFNENFTPTAKTLLSLGFTFVVPMDTIANSLSGSVENNAVKDLIGSVVIPGISEAMKSRLTWLKNNVLGIRGSPNIPDYIAKLFKATLEGDKVPTSVYKETKSSTSKTVLLLPIIPKILLSKNISKRKLTNNIRTVSGQFYSLVNLQMLLNTHLQDVVSANMGDGSRGDILNYRTGRFAASVKVERLTQSREGMISAFYNYMRNPYQTFEPGYKMGSLKTRDPKILISKSIREIAATKVGNRLRAVLV